jgi:kynurenine formamidase
MVDRKITLFATDLIGMDDPKEWWDPTHHVWLSNGVCMVQQLCNLDKLVGKQFLFVAMPIKMVGGTGCPLRAAALVL